jgi:integrase
MTARIFARHLAVLDPSTEIPPADVLPHHYRRVTPHLFATEEVAALLRAADGLRPPLRALTWRTLMGLLAVTGLRTGEACRLDDVDVDLGDALTVTIRDSKFGKHRLVPIHASTAAAVRNYQRARDRALPTVRTPALLVTTRGTRLDANICRTFADLVASAGITVPAGRRPPRLADFRHTFATTTLLDWYQDGADVPARMAQLSTYLGHADPKSTYWYLTGSPELLAIAASRLDHAFAAGHD